MELLSNHPLSCPYCGEVIELVVDGSVSEQEYTEDCPVCCRPMMVTVAVNTAYHASVRLRREDD